MVFANTFTWLLIRYHFFLRNLDICDYSDNSSSVWLEQIHPHSLENQLPSWLVFAKNGRQGLHHIPAPVRLFCSIRRHRYQLWRNLQVLTFPFVYECFYIVWKCSECMRNCKLISRLGDSMNLLLSVMGNLQVLKFFLCWRMGSFIVWKWLECMKIYKLDFQTGR